MKRISATFALFLWLIASVLAQVGTERAICNQMRQGGRVEIEQDSRLETLLTSKSKVYNAASHLQTNKEGKEVVILRGYRVRCFSGNNQIASRNEAQRIERDLKDYMPELSTYLFFRSPNWRLVVGNFRTSEEAIALMRDLKKHFPVYGQEMFVVSDEIEVPVQNQEEINEYDY